MYLLAKSTSIPLLCRGMAIVEQSVAVDHAVELAGLSEYTIVDYPRGSNLDDLLSALIEGRELDVSMDPATGLMRQLQKELEWLKAFNDPRGIYLLPEINFQFFK